MIRKIFFSFFALLLSVLLIKLFIFSVKDEDEERRKEFLSRYGIFALTLPKDCSFAGENVPMDDFEVRERLDRELLINTYWQSQSLLMHKRAARWFPVIEPILKKNNVPDDFKYLALIESGFMNVVSPSGAAGFWQFIESTGKKYNLEINSEVDERYHVEKATEAACKYLKEGHELFGSWCMAAASYNMGMDALKKSAGKQHANNYFDLLLNDETSRYLFRTLAMKEIISRPEIYGFHFRKKDLYTPFEYSIVETDSAIENLVAFADSNSINYKYLKLLNPWLRQSTLTNKNRNKYEIKILKSGFGSADDDDPEK